MLRDSQLVEAGFARAEAYVGRQAERLDALTPEDPPHWGPNIKRATFAQIRMTFDALIEAHFEGKRYRGKAHEERCSKLADEINELPRTKKLLARLVELGVVSLVQQHADHSRES